MRFWFTWLLFAGVLWAAEPETAGWMAALREDALLRTVALPGAHDAGTAGMPWYTCTQGKTIARQLREGVRYLDIRVGTDGEQPVIVHGPSKGMSLRRVLTELRDFLTAHPTETVLLDIPFLADGAEDAAHALLCDILDDRLYEAPTEDRVRCTDALHVGEVRGKALVFWGRASSPLLRDRRLLPRGNDAGTRTGVCLHSFYREESHMGDSETLVRVTLPHYLQRFRRLGSGFCVLQGQLTDGWGIRGPRLRESGHAARMDAFVRSLAQREELPWVNVILRDFATTEKNTLTLWLNSPKGLVKEEAHADFERFRPAPVSAK